DLGYEGQYPLQGCRSSHDLVGYRFPADLFAQSHFIAFRLLLRRLWIRDAHCHASHELPPNLESLHLARSLCSSRALWSLSRPRTTLDGVTAYTISEREEYPFEVREDQPKRGVRPNSSGLEGRCASIQKGEHRPTSHQVRAVPGRHPG